MNEQRKRIVLDLTRYEYIPAIPCAHDSPSVKIFEFWTEKEKSLNDITWAEEDTKDIVIKTKDGIQPLKLPKIMQENLLYYFKNKSKEFKDISCHALAFYIIHGCLDKKVKCKLQIAKDFKIGDTILMGFFKKILWKTIPVYCEHSAICITETPEGPLFFSKLGDKGKVVVMTFEEMKMTYWTTKSCAKIIWKN